MTSVAWSALSEGVKRTHTVYVQRRSVALAAAARKSAGFAQRALTGAFTLAGLGGVAAAAYLTDVRLGWFVGGLCAIVLAQVVKPGPE